MYQNIMNVQLLHHYFADGRFADVLLEPTSETMQSLNQAGIMSRKNGADLQLFAPLDKDLNTALMEVESLDFVVKPLAPQAYNYTDMPLNQPGYLSFQSQAGSAGNMSVDYVKSDGIATSQLALISIQCVDFLNDAQEIPVNYKVQFSARKVSVRYQIVVNGSNVTDLALDGADANLFNGPLTVELANGQEAQSFDSGDHTFELKEQMKIEVGAKGVVDQAESASSLIGQLPMPSPMNISQADQRVYAELYVYL